MIKSININTKKLNTPGRKIKAQRCAEKLLLIMQSQEFREMILDMPGKWRMGETSKYKDATNEEIYNLLTSREIINILIDDYYSRWSRVVGYMNPGSPWVYVNAKFFDSMGDIDVVSNLGHEDSHVQGLRHGGSDFRSSISYYINYCIKVLYPKIIDQTNNPTSHVEDAVKFKAPWYRRVWNWVRGLF